MARRVLPASLWILAFTLTALESVAGQNSRTQRPDSLILLDTVVARETRFLAQWYSAWRAAPSDDAAAYDTYAQVGPGRPQNFHCHPDQFGPYTPMTQGRLIQSRDNFFALCPSWDLSEVRSTTDERVWIDNALRASARDGARDARQLLITLLDSAARILPSNDFIAGQRVRFLIDQREYDGALTAARECAASGWWCAALAGYAHHVRGEFVHADSAFAVSFVSMPNAERCKWNDLRGLLDPSSRGAYGRLSCAARDSVNERLWWLADPLYIEPGNERRAEQNARRVLIALRSALNRDERFDWSDASAGDVRQAMILRYGWPAQIVWGGPMQDRSHTAYLASHTTPPSEPYTTNEYSAGRVHTIPPWTAVGDPFHARPDDWTVSEPPPSDRPRPAQLTRLPSGQVVSVPWLWWPTEHFAPRRPLVQLPDAQHALLRRQDSIHFAVATSLSKERVGRATADTIRNISLILSDKPGSVQRVTESSGIVGSPLVMQALIESRPSVAGVEFTAPGMSGASGGRLRFGITPPPPLSVLRPGTIAVSRPVILRAPAADGALPNDAEGALRLMSPTTRVGAAGRIGVYWETYGLLPSDTVEIAVWIERHTSQGIVRRFGIALRVATDLNTPVAVSWREPQPANRAHFAGGVVPVMGRSVVLDTSKLPKGEYWLDVAVRKAGDAEAVRERTGFVVQ